MKREYKRWSKLILLGAADVEAGNVEKALYQYDRAWMLASHLIDDTIMVFENDLRPLNWVSYACCCLVQVHIRTNNPAAARLCLERTGRKFLTVLSNSGYPLLVRGKVIREFEPLMNLAIQFYQAQGRPDEAFSMVGDWLTEVRRYVGQMRPICQTIQMN